MLHRRALFPEIQITAIRKHQHCKHTRLQAINLFLAVCAQTAAVFKKNPITFSSIHISVQHCFPRYQYYYREHQLLGQYVPNKTTKQQKINMTVIIHNSSFLVNYFYQHVESSHALHAYASFSSWVTLNLKRNKHKLNQTQRNF